MSKQSKVKLKPARKPHVRHVFGRLRNVPALGKLWTFELTRDGVKVRRRNSRKVDTLDFGRLAACSGGVLAELPSGERFSFALGESGLEVRQGERKPKTVPWVELSNFGRTQLVLFPGEKLPEEAPRKEGALL